MRKFYVLSLMAAGALSASAQMPLSSKVETAQCTMSEYNSVYSFSKIATKAPHASFMVLPFESDGMYRCGVLKGTGFFEAAFDFFSGNNTAYLGAASSIGVDRPTFSWTTTSLNGNTVELPTDEYGNALVNLFGIYNFPVLKGELNGEVATYERLSDSECKAKAAYLSTLFATEFPLCMGDAGFSGGELFSGFNETIYFGTGMKNEDGDLLTGVYAAFNKTTAPMRIYGVTVPITRVNSGDPIPAGVSLDVEIWKMDEDGALVELLGSASGDAASNLTGDASKGMWTFDVTFTDVDDLGMPIDKPVVVPANTRFAVAVKNIDKANLKLLFRDHAFEGSAYILYGDKVGTVGFSNAPNTPRADYMISLTADMPSAMWQDKTLNCPVEGGLAMVDDKQQFAILYTTTPLVNAAEEVEYEVVAPDWITVGDLQLVEDENGGWDYYRAYTLELTASALPSGESGRQGVVTVKCPGGVEKSFQIGQGEWTPTGIENVEAAEAAVVVAGDSFQLTYGDEFNRAAVYSVSGAKVASYALPQGGSFEVPAADLNGVYMVVFEGQAKKVVKVVK